LGILNIGFQASPIKELPRVYYHSLEEAFKRRAKGGTKGIHS